MQSSNDIVANQVRTRRFFTLFRAKMLGIFLFVKQSAANSDVKASGDFVGEIFEAVSIDRGLCFEYIQKRPNLVTMQAPGPRPRGTRRTNAIAVATARLKNRTRFPEFRGTENVNRRKVSRFTCGEIKIVLMKRWILFLVSPGSSRKQYSKNCYRKPIITASQLEAVLASMSSM